jgi:hypothetical protein
MYDVIGDIHGHADKLEALLDVMGYVKAGRGYQAPVGRQVVFLGDLIDRGPTQLRVLEIARAMVEAGAGRCILGNHELTAIGFMTPCRENPNEFLRPQSAKNRKQHREFLDQVGEGSDQHMGWIEWFKTLPLFLDLAGIRAVHGTWNEVAAAQVGRVYWDQTGQRMSDEFLYGSYVKGSELMAARKLLTCGVEWDLPDGMFIQGKGGEQHGEVRIANWRHWAKRLPEVALVPEGNEGRVPDVPIPDHLPMDAIEGPPVFIGHHWFDGHPAIESPKLACLDWSAAKGGKLVGYRWDGEAELSNDKLVWVGKTRSMLPGQ